MNEKQADTLLNVPEIVKRAKIACEPETGPSDRRAINNEIH